MPDVIGQYIADILNRYKKDELTLAEAVKEIEEIAEVL